jgi:hypothetical protein
MARRKKPVAKPEPVEQRTVNNGAVRRWAESKGLKVSAKGRIKATIVEAYLNRDSDDVVETSLKTEGRDGEEFNKFAAITRPTGKNRRRLPCGFCATHGKSADHKLCPRVVKNASPLRADRKWQCICWEKNPKKHLEPGEEIPEDLWTPRPRR